MKPRAVALLLASQATWRASALHIAFISPGTSLPASASSDASFTRFMQPARAPARQPPARIVSLSTGLSPTEAVSLAPPPAPR
jgi:hypothetical protein